MRYFVVTEQIGRSIAATRGIVLAETYEGALKKVEIDGRFPLEETSPFYLEELALIGGE